MLTIGFPISDKENENRRAILPCDIKKMRCANALYFESGYGQVLGISDLEYINAGAKVVDRNNVLNQNIICDPKIGDAKYLVSLKNQTIFGWIHAVQNKEITNKITERKLTAYAWEDMYDRGRHLFWRNNELAGEAAVLHAFQCYGCMPYETKVAVIGRGNTARGAMKVLNMLGANVVQYDRRTEKLLRAELGQFDVVVNCVLWDTSRLDHIIYRKDLRRMKKHSMIIDISCDRCGGIETSVPTTIENPTYIVDGVLHYVVDHTPALYFKTFTRNNSKIIYPYLDDLVMGVHNEVLERALIIENGVIIDNRITLFQGKNVF